jgi:hypothetical protein
MKWKIIREEIDCSGKKSRNGETKEAQNTRGLAKINGNESNSKFNDPLTDTYTSYTNYKLLKLMGGTVCVCVTNFLILSIIYIKL